MSANRILMVAHLSWLSGLHSIYYKYSIIGFAECQPARLFGARLQLTFLLLVWYPVNIHYTGLFIHGFPVSKRLRLHLYHLNGRQMQGFKRAVELRNTLLCRFNSFVNAIDAFSQPCLDAFFLYGFRLRDEWPCPGGGKATESENSEERKIKTWNQNKCSIQY